MIAGLAIAAVLAASPAPIAPAVVPVTGDFVTAGYTFDSAMQSAGRVSVDVTDSDKSAATFGGVPLAEVLRAAGASVGDAVRGKAARTIVVVHAADGYSAAFSLAELRTSAGRCAPILATTRDGAPLPSGTGPVRIVAPCDLTHARWVHGVASLSVLVVDDPAMR